VDHLKLPAALRPTRGSMIAVRKRKIYGSGPAHIDTAPTALVNTNDGPKITQEETHLQTLFSKLSILSPPLVSSQQGASQWVSHSGRRSASCLDLPAPVVKRLISKL
jgi:hypothetical protein